MKLTKERREGEDDLCELYRRCDGLSMFSDPFGMIKQLCKKVVMNYRGQATTIAQLEKQDIVHWKTRRTLLKKIEAQAQEIERLKRCQCTPTMGGGSK